MAALYKPKDAFFFGQQFYDPKRIYPADDYQVVTNPHLFENVEQVVEQATAAPGETRKRARKPAAKK